MDKLIIAACLLGVILYYKFVFVPNQKLKKELKDAAKPKDTVDAQDDDFCLIASAISKCKTDTQLFQCLGAIKIFKSKYGDSKTGAIDVKQLIELLDVRQQKHFIA